MHVGAGGFHFGVDFVDAGNQGLAFRAAGGEVIAAACIVDRSGGRADVGVPLVALATLDVPAYEADKLPPELAAIPVQDPGSRRLR